MKDLYPGIDRRRFQRVNVKFIASYKVEDPLEARALTLNREIPSIAMDLSEEGIALSTEYKIATAAILMISFPLFSTGTMNDDDARFIQIRGEVRYRVLVEETNDYRLGIQFKYVSNEDKDAIVRFINERKIASYI